MATDVVALSMGICISLRLSLFLGKKGPKTQAKITSTIGFLPAGQPFSWANPIALRAYFGKARPPMRRELGIRFKFSSRTPDIGRVRCGWDPRVASRAGNISVTIG